jgi:hypothetical protein
MPITASDFDDPRIGKLPVWAQELIHVGDIATRSVTHWRNRVDELSDKIDEMRVAHAAERGAVVYDTWTSEDGSDGSEVRTGLGVGIPVRFGDSADICETFTVTYRDGGLDIEVQRSDYVLKSGSMRSPTLRIE